VRMGDYDWEWPDDSDSVIGVIKHIHALENETEYSSRYRDGLEHEDCHCWLH
jgi:hypothetical protein